MTGSGRSWRWRAVAATAIGLLVIAGCGGDDDGSVTRNDAGVIVEGGRLDPLLLRTGDCLDDSLQGSEVAFVEGVPCGDAHQWEVYYAFAIGEGDNGAYPGDDIADLTAREGCEVQFEPFIGAAQAESTFVVNYIRPTAASWSDGDRTVHCLVGNGDGTDKTGTAEGANS